MKIEQPKLGLGRQASGIPRRTFLSVAAAVPIAGIFGPGVRASSLPGPRLRTDLDIVQAAMSIHPGLSLHRSQRAIASASARFEAEYLAAAQVESIAGVYLALSRYLTALRCGHSYANFFNQDDADVKQLFDRPTRLPFWFRWIGEKTAVIHDPSDMKLPRGTEILQLNGRSAREVLVTLLSYTRADGSNDGKRRSLLSVEGREDLETFDIFQGLLLPPANGLHELTVQLPNGQTGRRRCAPIALAQRRAMMTRVAPESDAPRWQWQRRADNVVVLTMPGWAMWNSKWDWRSWLDERLDSLGDARGFIIDIRENEGGDDCGDPILARLIDRPVTGWPFDTRIRFDRMPTLLRENSSTWDAKFYSLGNGARPLGGGYFRPAALETQSTITPSPKKIACPAVALIGPVNSSSTFAFINAARATGRVTLIGEPTGGNRQGVNGGSFLFVKLPFSGIEFDLPLKGYIARKAQPDVGIGPDIAAPVTLERLRVGTDEPLNRAVRHCLS